MRHLRDTQIAWATMTVVLLAPLVRSQTSAQAEDAPLVLTAQIPLPGVRGRFDHFAFDPAEPGRMFLSALGNNSVEVINAVEGTEAHRISGIPEPQGVAYAPELNRLFVASRRGKLYIYDGATYNLVTTIDFKGDVDNLRYDATSKRVYVAYGDDDKAAIGIVDAITNRRLEQEYKTGVHPESFQVESGTTIYANLEGLKQIGIINLATRKMGAWPLPNHFAENFPMALDESHHRLFIATRVPPRLVIFDTLSGKMVAALPAVADVDDLYYDPTHKRVYVPGGQGFVDVFQQKDPDHYQRLARVPSVVGARTAGYSPRVGKKGQNHFYLAVPTTPGKEAAVWIFTVEE
jgi:DNA-binding beta-propeller fold protein YncE